jgi:hypothetical protein
VTDDHLVDVIDEVLERHRHGVEPAPDRRRASAPTQHQDRDAAADRDREPAATSGPSAFAKQGASSRAVSHRPETETALVRLSSSTSIFALSHFSNGNRIPPPAGVYYRAGLRPDPLAEAGIFLKMLSEDGVCFGDTRF